MTDASLRGDAAPLAFVMVKAFGDLTIIASVLRRLAAADRARCMLLVAPHLADLATVLAPDCEVQGLSIEPILPPLFDIQKHRKIGRIVGSALELRRSLATAAPGATLVFDRLSWRERFIVGRRAALAVERGQPLTNVYATHEALLRDALPFMRIESPVATPPSASGTRRIGLLPFSRVAAKNVPVALVESMAAKCRAHDFEPVVLLLEGEDFPNLPGLATERLPRRFDALVQGIASVGAVISADSLPAHLAEYNGRAAFVASPVRNVYYLPPMAFAGGHWGLFSEPAELDRRLVRFLDMLK